MTLPRFRGFFIIHRHIGGLEITKEGAYDTPLIHRHIGGLESY